MNGITAIYKVEGKSSSSQLSRALNDYRIAKTKKSTSTRERDYSTNFLHN